MFTNVILLIYIARYAIEHCPAEKTTSVAVSLLLHLFLIESMYALYECGFINQLICYDRHRQFLRRARTRFLSYLSRGGVNLARTCQTLLIQICVLLCRSNSRGFAKLPRELTFFMTRFCGAKSMGD